MTFLAGKRPEGLATPMVVAWRVPRRLSAKAIRFNAGPIAVAGVRAFPRLNLVHCGSEQSFPVLRQNCRAKSPDGQRTAAPNIPFAAVCVHHEG
jgi:hypothetical protein